MASPVKLYQQELHSNLGYFATWFPGDEMQLGHVGVLKEGRFRKFSTLQELNIPCTPGSSGRPQTLNYSSTADTRVSSSAGASAPGIATAEIAIKFSRQGAFVFQAAGVQSLDLANRNATALAILRAYEQGAWNKEWFVVDSMYEAECATIIVSEDKSAEIVLSGTFAAPLGSLPLADPKLGLTVSSSSGKIVHVIAGNGLRPLYSCLQLKDPLFGAPSVVSVRGGNAGERAAQALTRPGINDLLDS